MVTPDRMLALGALIVIAFSSNLPLGYMRQKSRKYSLLWFVYIHLSIPPIVILRSLLGFSWRWIPLTLACAVAGQLVGGQFYKRGRI